MRHAARLFGCFLVLAACSSHDTTGTVSSAVISDGSHGSQSVPGFYFRDPMVPNVPTPGTFAPNASPTVRIDHIDPATGAVLGNVVTFATMAPHGSAAPDHGDDYEDPDSDEVDQGTLEKIKVRNGFYAVDWHTDLFNLDVTATYRIGVFVGTREYGFADVDLVGTAKEARNVNTNAFVPLVDGRTLPIKFRIETVAPVCPATSHERVGLVVSGYVATGTSTLPASHVYLGNTELAPDSAGHYSFPLRGVDGAYLVDDFTESSLPKGVVAAVRLGEGRIQLGQSGRFKTGGKTSVTVVATIAGGTFTNVSNHRGDPFERGQDGVSVPGSAGQDEYQLANGVLTLNTTVTGRSDFVDLGTTCGGIAAPGAPILTSVTAGDKVATVAFTPPADTGGAPITSYIATASPGGITTTGTTSPITVTGLTDGTAYTFTVQAVNAAGTSAASAASAPATPVGRPGAPAIASVTVGDGTATVAVTTPDSGGLPIASYLVTASPGGITALAATSPIVVTGLTNGQPYTFTVTATNAAGSSPASAPSAPVTPTGAPTAPAITGVAAGNGFVDVSFTLPANTGGFPITSYDVTSRPDGIAASGAASPIRVTGLTNGRAYTFTVAARNQLGAGPSSAPSGAATPLGAPTAPMITGVVAGDASVAVAFAAPASDGGSPITGYTVTSIPAGFTATGTASPIAISVPDGVAFMFVVTATNAQGVSPATTPSAPATATGVPGSPAITGTTPHDRSVTVAFSAPASTGGLAITAYLVTSSPGGLTQAGAASPLTVSGLTDGQAYTFTVVAINAKGPSAPSAPSPATTPVGLPGAPSITSVATASGSATIAFTPPASNGGLAITLYTATANPGGLTASGSTSPLTIAGLTNGVAYTFTVTATNALGTGPASPSVGQTPRGAPDAPQITGVSEAGSGAIAIAFAPPASDGGNPITSYTVTSNPGNLVASGATSPIVVTGLTNGRSYTFTAVATNVAGSSPASAASSAIAPTGPPGAPTIMSVTAGDGQAVVAFAAPASNGGSPITSYTVASSPGGLTATGDASPLTVTGLADGTCYYFTVTATNANGTSPASAQSSSCATPLGPPSAPAIASVSIGDGTATVAFTPPAFTGGSPITSYIVTSSPDGLTSTGASSPLVVTGLVNGTAYTFAVVAVNAQGASASSPASDPVTPLGTPDAPAISSVVAGNGTATITFAPPANTGGAPITSYTVTSSPDGITSSGASSPIVVTGLTNGVRYVFTVTATNAVGTGPASAASSAGVTPTSVPSAPSIVSAVAGDSSVTVTFTAPADNGGLPIQSYTVTSIPGGFSASGPASPLTVTGLTNGASYTFIATASNADGSSPSSAASAAVVPTGVPGAPVITSVASGASQATIAFAAPSATGGLPITSYTVTSNPGGQTATGASSPITVTGLTNGQSYTFTVTATNAAGTGPASAPSTNGVVPVGVPGAPTVTSVATSSGHATISFAAPADNGGSAITSYTITSNPGGFTSTGPASPLTVTDLTNGVSYTFTVTATNSAGTGQASAPSDPVIPGGLPGAPTITTVSAGTGQATIAFTPPASNGGLAITSYTATSSPGGITASGSASPIVVSGLINGVSYTFTVTATNSAGTGPASVASSPGVTPTGPPGAPTITGVTAGNAQVSVAFTAPASNGGLTITSYTATSNDGKTATGSSSPLVVTGLTNGQSYSFTVKATNSAGNGPASAPSSTITPVGPPGAPTIGTATASGSQTISVAFTAPASNGGAAITSYTATSSPGGFSKTGTASPLLVTGLANGVAYTFTVKATNSTGFTSVASSPSNSATSAGPPGAPTITGVTAANAQVTVAFSAPANSGGSPITSYTATSSPGGITKTGANSPITVTGLTNGVSYTFTVKATNAIGTGPASAASAAITPSTVPQAPTGVTATAGDGQATVSFNVLTDVVSTGGALITSYTVTSDPGSISVTGTTAPMIVSGLTNGVTYRFTAFATNRNGNSPLSTASAPITLGNLGQTIIMVNLALNSNLPDVIDTATGYGLNQDGSEYDFDTKQIVIPIPSIPPNVANSNQPYIVTLDPDTTYVTTYFFSYLDVQNRLEYNFDGSLRGDVPSAYNIYYVTTNLTLVDALSDPNTQLDPFTLAAVSTNIPYTITPTPPRWSINGPGRASLQHDDDPFAPRRAGGLAAAPNPGTTDTPPTTDEPVAEVGGCNAGGGSSAGALLPLLGLVMRRARRRDKRAA